MSSLFKKAKDRTSKEKAGHSSTGSSGQSSSTLYDPHNPLNAPTEVAQATQFHTARNAGEISFKKGDFFHILSDKKVANDGTIEIFDPIHNRKGRAPANCFKIFEKTHRINDGTDRTSGSSGQFASSPVSTGKRISETSQNSHSPAGSAPREKPLATLFGVVLYDFHAERPDELSVSAGDIIFICAHHEYEWYIAKFLNKVGEVGLVPVSYVQLIDAVTRIPYKESPRLIIDNENLPTVDDWKALKNKHKASSRAVGAASLHNVTGDYLPSSRRTSNNTLSRNASQTDSVKGSSLTRSPFKKNINQSLVLPVTANIESFSSTNNKFWFLVRVAMSDGSTRSLCRFYEDFFNFHQKLLSAWPHEGGKFDTKERKERILPFIPGPIIDVTESLCHRRMIDLSEYLVILLQLPDYISKSNLVISFFDLLEGDESSTPGTSAHNFAPVEPNRPAPNLKIINTDNNRHPQPKSQQYSQYPTYPQQQQQLQQQNSQQSFAEMPSQQSNDRKSQYDSYGANRNSNPSKFNEPLGKTHSTSSLTQTLSQLNMQNTPPPSQNAASSKHSQGSKLKLKFYYNDDIFAVAVPSDISLVELKKVIVPKIDESDTPNVEVKLQLYSKNSSNQDYLNFDASDNISTDDQLWNDENFVDKGKFLVIV